MLAGCLDGWQGLRVGANGQLLVADSANRSWAVSSSPADSRQPEAAPLAAVEEQLRAVRGQGGRFGEAGDRGKRGDRCGRMRGGGPGGGGRPFRTGQQHLKVLKLAPAGNWLAVRRARTIFGARGGDWSGVWLESQP
ncbi:MAG: hypothetical protein HY319_10385 [Armatimonadetes bacterium]|nr:hypothetical protein [Armatimonadota bacterium]